jgi:hypothetical protein
MVRMVSHNWFDQDKKLYYLQKLIKNIKWEKNYDLRMRHFESCGSSSSMFNNTGGNARVLEGDLRNQALKSGETKNTSSTSS